MLYHELASGDSHDGHLSSAQLLNVQLVGSTFHLYVPHSSLDVVVPDEVWSAIQNVVASGVDFLHSIPVASHLLRSGVMDELYAFTAAPAQEEGNTQSGDTYGAEYDLAMQCPVERDTFGRLVWLDDALQVGRSNRSGNTVPMSDFHERHGALLLRLLGLEPLSFVESTCTSRAKGPQLWGLELHIGALNVSNHTQCCSVEKRHSLLYTGAEFKNVYHRTVDGIHNMFRFVNDLCFHPATAVSDLQLFLHDERDVLPEFLQFFPVQQEAAVGAVRTLDELIAASQSCPVCFLAPVSIGVPARHCSRRPHSLQQHRGWADYYMNSIDRTVNVSATLQRVALTQLVSLDDIAARPLQLTGTASGRGSTVDPSHQLASVQRYYESGGNATLSVFPVPADLSRPLRILMLARPQSRRWVNATWMADIVCRAVSTRDAAAVDERSTSVPPCDLTVTDPSPSKDNDDFRRLIEQFRSVDVLVAVHGAGLTNIQYLRPGALLLDFIPMCSKYAMGEWLYDPTALYPREDRNYTPLSEEFRVHFVSIFAGTSECYSETAADDTSPAAARINQTRNLTEEARAADLTSHLQTVLGAFTDMQQALIDERFDRYNRLSRELRALSAGLNPRGRLYWPMIHVNP